MKKIYLITTICSLLLSGVGIFCWAALMKSAKAKMHTASELDKAYSPGKPDPAKVKLLAEVCQNMSMDKGALFIQGVINASNGADSSDKLSHIEYVFAKSGNIMYYKLGQVESINTPALNVYIDNGMKKIMLSASKKALPLPVVPDLTSLLSRIEEEGYTLSEKVQGETTTLSLNNPYHVSCKNYSVSFSTLTLQVEKIFCRMSNFQNPENDKMDNQFEVSFSSFNSHPVMEKYNLKQFIRKVNNKWALSSALKDYELVDML